MAYSLKHNQNTKHKLKICYRLNLHRTTKESQRTEKRDIDESTEWKRKLEQIHVHILVCVDFQLFICGHGVESEKQHRSNFNNKAIKPLMVVGIVDQRPNTKKNWAHSCNSVSNARTASAEYAHFGRQNSWISPKIHFPTLNVDITAFLMWSRIFGFGWFKRQISRVFLLMAYFSWSCYRRGKKRSAPNKTSIKNVVWMLATGQKVKVQSCKIAASVFHATNHTHTLCIVSEHTRSKRSNIRVL